MTSSATTPHPRPRTASAARPPRAGHLLGHRLGGALIVGTLAAAAGIFAPAPARACGGYPAPPEGTPAEDSPYTQAYHMLLYWPDDLDGPADVLLGMDVYAGSNGFGFIIPVPEPLSRGSISAGSTLLLGALSAYTGPRAFDRRCSNYRPARVYECPPPSDGGDGGDGGGGCGAPTEASGVEVTESFELGVYEIALLSAEGAEGLQVRLEAEGLAIPEGAMGLTEDYIEAGFHFVAVRVPEGAEVPDGDRLPPLWLGFDGPLRSPPLRLGASAAPAPQDVFITTFAENMRSIGISNVLEETPEDGCM